MSPRIVRYIAFNKAHLFLHTLVYISLIPFLYSYPTIPGLLQSEADTPDMSGTKPLTKERPPREWRRATTKIQTNTTLYDNDIRPHLPLTQQHKFYPSSQNYYPLQPENLIHNSLLSHIASSTKHSASHLIPHKHSKSTPQSRTHKVTTLIHKKVSKYATLRPYATMYITFIFFLILLLIPKKMNDLPSAYDEEEQRNLMKRGSSKQMPPLAKLRKSHTKLTLFLPEGLNRATVHSFLQRLYGRRDSIFIQSSPPITRQVTINNEDHTYFIIYHSLWVPNGVASSISTAPFVLRVHNTSHEIIIGNITSQYRAQVNFMLHPNQQVNASMIRRQLTGFRVPLIRFWYINSETVNAVKFDFTLSSPQQLFHLTDSFNPATLTINGITKPIRHHRPPPQNSSYHSSRPASNAGYPLPSTSSKPHAASTAPPAETEMENLKETENSNVIEREDHPMKSPEQSTDIQVPHSTAKTTPLSTAVAKLPTKSIDDFNDAEAPPAKISVDDHMTNTDESNDIEARPPTNHTNSNQDMILSESSSTNQSNENLPPLDNNILIPEPLTSNLPSSKRKSSSPKTQQDSARQRIHPPSLTDGESTPIKKVIPSFALAHPLLVNHHFFRMEVLHNHQPQENHPKEVTNSIITSLTPLDKKNHQPITLVNLPSVTRTHVNKTLSSPTQSNNDKFCPVYERNHKINQTSLKLHITEMNTPNPNNPITATTQSPHTNNTLTHTYTCSPAIPPSPHTVPNTHQEHQIESIVNSATTELSLVNEHKHKINQTPSKLHIAQIKIPNPNNDLSNTTQISPTNYTPTHTYASSPENVIPTSLCRPVLETKDEHTTQIPDKQSRQSNTPTPQQSNFPLISFPRIITKTLKNQTLPANTPATNTNTIPNKNKLYLVKEQTPTIPHPPPKLNISPTNIPVSTYLTHTINQTSPSKRTPIQNNNISPEPPTSAHAVSNTQHIATNQLDVTDTFAKTVQEHYTTSQNTDLQMPRTDTSTPLEHTTHTDHQTDTQLSRSHESEYDYYNIENRRARRAGKAPMFPNKTNLQIHILPNTFTRPHIYSPEPSNSLSSINNPPPSTPFFTNNNEDYDNIVPPLNIINNPTANNHLHLPTYATPIISTGTTPNIHHPPPNTPSLGIIRNIQGLRSNNNNHKLPLFLAELTTHNAQFGFLSETHAHTPSILRKTRYQFPNFIPYSDHDKTQTKMKEASAGTAIYLHKDWARYVSDTAHFRDRCTGLLLRPPQHHPLLLMCVYHPADHSSTEGKDTLTALQTHITTSVHRFKRQYPNLQIIIGGDFNATINPFLDRTTSIGHKSEPSRLQYITDLGLIDIWRLTHPDERKYTHTTNVRSNTNPHPIKSESRIDNVFISPSLVPTSTATIENHRISTKDHHKPIFLRINMDLSLPQLTTTTSLQQQRKYKTKNLHHSTRSAYIQSVEQHLQDLQQATADEHHHNITAALTHAADKLLTKDTQKKPTPRKLPHHELWYKLVNIKCNPEDTPTNRKIIRRAAKLTKTSIPTPIPSKQTAKFLLDTLQTTHNAKLRHQIKKAKLRRETEKKHTHKHFLKNLLNDTATWDGLHYVRDHHTGELILEPTTVKNYTSSFWSGLFCKSPQHTPLPDKFKHSFTRVEHNPAIWNNITDPFTNTEITQILQQAPTGKAPGPSGITWDMLKILISSPSFITSLTKFTNKCYTTNYIPIQETIAEAILLPKKDDWANLLANTRPITLLETLHKLMEALMNNRLKHIIYTNNLLKGLNFGFVPGQGCAENLATLQSVINHAQLHRPNNKPNPIYGVNLDIQKAFDSVPFQAMNLTMRRLGIPKKHSISQCNYSPNEPSASKHQQGTPLPLPQPMDFLRETSFHLSYGISSMTPSSYTYTLIPKDTNSSN